MRFTWHFADNDWLILRHPKGYPFGIVQRSTKDTWGFLAFLLEPGFPACGPYKSRHKAAAWLRERFLKMYPEHECEEAP